MTVNSASIILQKLLTLCYKATKYRAIQIPFLVRKNAKKQLAEVNVSQLFIKQSEGMQDMIYYRI